LGKQIFEIDGKNFSTLEEFAKEFSSKLNLQIEWNGNLDAFNDILGGGFGTPDEGFVIVWKNSSLSKEKLSYNETIKQLEKKLERCHPTNRKHFLSEIKLTKDHKSSTVFDWIVKIIEYEEHNDIELRLE
jgi:RNAse (barnase) inhibitor barstar